MDECKPLVGGAAATAYDTFGQVFFCILRNPRDAGSTTLFGIRRLAIYGEDEAPDSPYTASRGGFAGYPELGARLGRAVQLDPMKPKLKPPGTKRLKL